MTGFNIQQCMTASTSRATMIRLDLIMKASFAVVHFLSLCVYMYRHKEAAKMSLKVSEKH